MKKLLIYYFRNRIIKTKKIVGEVSRKNQASLLEIINKGEVSLFEGKNWKDLFREEFESEGSTEFYQELVKYEPQENKEKVKQIWNFIFRNYYWKKLEVRKNIKQEMKVKLKEDMRKYNADYLELLSFQEEEFTGSKAKNNLRSLGNVTLFNSTLPNESWDERKNRERIFIASSM